MAASLLVVAAIGAGSARAENVALPNWPTLLPAAPGTPSGAVPLEEDTCPRGQLACPRRVIREMTRRWLPLDESCDHRAVFALTYLRTTEEYLRTVEGDPDFFEDPAWVNHVDAVFAELYFQAFDEWEAGEPVPEAWRIAFEAAASPNLTATGDLLLGMNAHINRDLPYTLAHVGLVNEAGGSRKLDHDRVNEFLDRVIDPLQDELNARYDPLFSFMDAEPSPAEEVSALQMIRGFRENAWRNAERLVRAASEAERELVAATIELEAAAGARAIEAANTLPGYGPSRDAYCASA